MATLAPQRPAIRWWSDRTALLALLEHLAETGAIESATDAIAVVEKPWKWTPEYRQMLADRTRAAA